jgi:hypothetical protein
MYFYRNSEYGTDAKYCGGFNTLPEFQENGIGAAALKAIFSKESQQYSLHANCSIDIPLGTLQLYTRDLGMRVIDFDGLGLSLYLPRQKPAAQTPTRITLSSASELANALHSVIGGNNIVTGIFPEKNGAVTLVTERRQLAA